MADDLGTFERKKKRYKAYKRRAEFREVGPVKGTGT